MKSFSELINSEKPVLVDFFAEWCGPCKTMAPILSEVKGLMGEEVKIVKVDVDRNPEAALAYKVSGVPTLIVFKNGQIRWRQSGVVSGAQLMQVLKSQL